MTTEQIKISYNLAEDVYNGNKTLKEAKELGAESHLSQFHKLLLHIIQTHDEWHKAYR